MALLQVENLSFTYPGQEKKALRDISFSLPKGSFTLLIGASGCGKTTLLKRIKKEIAPAGEETGEILFADRPIGEIPFQKIGYVSQSPDNQIVTDKVWHELAFGLENMGLSHEEIRLRVGETASYFGIGGWYRHNTDELSGGQKQILNLAAAVAIRPELLLLDEPTAQLDPIAASRFLDTVARLHRELGITVLMSEHRQEEALPMADRVLALEEGEMLCFDTPRAICQKLKDHTLSAGLPSAARIFTALNGKGECPLTVREGQAFLAEKYPAVSGKVTEKEKNENATALELKSIFFRYKRTDPDVLRDLDLQVGKGEIFSVLGANSSGKSTLLRVIAGLSAPYRGERLFFGDRKSRKEKGCRKGVVLLPQDPTALFLKNTVAEDLTEGLLLTGVSKAEAESRTEKWVERLGLQDLLSHHPYDVSGGEQQKCALAKLLVTNPKMVLLDEPTKGLDAAFKDALKTVLRELKQEGVTVIAVTHDVEFAADVSDRCALLFDGAVIASGTPNTFFSKNDFYTTAAARMARGRFENAVLVKEVVELCKKEP